jgi:hypothetical protein
MTALLALWLCGLCVVGIYYSMPPSGSMRQDIYGLSLWILSSFVLAVSATILVVSIVSPLGIHPRW